MAQAEKTPERQPANKQMDLVSRFRQEYEIAIGEAATSAAHTDTDGWQRLYAGFRDSQRGQRLALAKRLKDLSEVQEKEGLSEDGEKSLGDCKKDIVELRVCGEIFESKTVGPVREPVDTCRSLIADATRAAQNEEARTPLINIGLAELMKAEIDKAPKATWDDETGRVSVK